MEVWHGLAGWSCFRRFPEAGAGLRADDGANPVSDAGSSLVAADLCLAELRSVSEIPCAEGFPRLLAGKARWSVVFGNGRAFPADQAGRAVRGRRRVQVALIWTDGRWAKAKRAHHANFDHAPDGGHGASAPLPTLRKN